jgi:predicted PurR-regulated permease PerM
MVWEVALVVFLLVLSLLVLLLIPTVLQLRTTLSRISTLVENVNKELPKILGDVSLITHQASKATERIQNVVDDIVDIERRISHEIKRPAVEIASMIGGLLKGIQTILSFFSRK